MSLIKVTKEFTFDAAHRLMNHPSKCKNLHGHTYKVQVELGMPVCSLHEDGMVMDFGVLKQEIMEPLLGHFDHSVILDLGDPLLTKLEGMDLKIVTMDGPPTAEAMATYFGKQISKEISGGDLSLISVRVWETPTSFAEYEGEGVSPCQIHICP